MSVKDNMSAAIVGMKNSVTNFRSDITYLQKELDGLNATRVQLRMDLTVAKREAQQAQKAFESLGDSATEAERAAAKADWRQAEENLENIRQQYELVGRQVRQTTRDMEDASGAISRADNRASAAMSGSTGLMATLGQAGVWSTLGDVAGQWASALVTSGSGADAGTLFSSALGYAGNGAAIGTMFGPAGTVVGAGIGGLVGLLSGANQVAESRDEAFKSYYSGVYDTQSQAMAENITAGGSTASQRELDAIAFDKLLKGQGSAFLDDLREMAADTPMEYSDLTTMSRALATGFGKDPGRMLGLMTGLGNAGSAVGMSASDMTVMAQALSRMESSNKASLEYLNMFQERGVDVIGMLASSLGISQGEVYDKISGSEISGTQAVDIIEAGLDQYAGAMEEMARTYSGRESTLSDTMAEIYNASGETYNASRSEAMQQEIDAYGGALGEALQEAYGAIGAGKAALENQSEAYTRDVLSTVLEGKSLKMEWDDSAKKVIYDLRSGYLDAMAAFEAGDEAAGFDIQGILTAAEGLAQQQHEASDLYKQAQEAETDSLAALRENTAALEAATSAYLLEQERTKGRSTIWSEQRTTATGTWMDDGGNVHGAPTDGMEGFYDEGGTFRPYVTSANGYASGLNRVPRDGYYYLHEDESVSTAQETASKGQGKVFVFNVTGNTFTAGLSADEFAQRLADTIERKLAGGVLS